MKKRTSRYLIVVYRGRLASLPLVGFSTKTEAKKYLNDESLFHDTSKMKIIPYSTWNKTRKSKLGRMM